MKRLLLAFCLIVLFLTSCAKEEVEPPADDKSPEQETVASNEEPLVPEVIPPIEYPIVEEPEFFSRLTGLGCTEEERNKRPVAVMYNNNHVSYPQNSISLADIVYECDAEGGLTRLMAVFSDWDKIGEIGSVRSARDYFVSLSESHGAIYVNAGGSPSAYEKLINGHVDYLDGVNMTKLPKNTFYRSNERIWNNGYEHSMMTAGEKLSAAVDFMGYSTTVGETFESPFAFAREDVIKGNTASTVSLKHSSYITTRFDYNAENGNYAKFSFGEPHVDGINGEQLTFKNVIILFIEEKIVDEEGRLDVDLTSGGSGYYFTNGRYTEITWTRATNDSPFVLKDSDGEILLSPGKTHITLFNQNNKNKITIK